MKLKADFFEIPIIPKKNDLYNDCSQEFRHLITLNADILINFFEIETFKEISKDCFITIDGRVLQILLRFVSFKGKIQKVSGSDLIYDIPTLCKSSNKKVFLLGGYQESNRRATEKMKHLGVEVSGYAPPFSHYPFPDAENVIILDQIRLFRPDILLVAFGSPKQELWINDCKNGLIESGVKLAIGCGGSLEFFSGMIKRSPKIISYLGLEGLYRFLVEPSKKRFKRLIRSVRILYYITKVRIEG